MNRNSIIYLASDPGKHMDIVGKYVFDEIKSNTLSSYWKLERNNNFNSVDNVELVLNSINGINVLYISINNTDTYYYIDKRRVLGKNISDVFNKSYWFDKNNNEVDIKILDSNLIQVNMISVGM